MSDWPPPMGSEAVRADGKSLGRIVAVWAGSVEQVSTTNRLTGKGYTLPRITYGSEWWTVDSAGSALDKFIGGSESGDPDLATRPREDRRRMMDLERHLERQSAWSRATFGPGHRTGGVIDHIRKELVEIEEAPLDLSEWADVVILALDGAWRTGASPAEVVEMIEAKQTKNEAREWPDWRTLSEDQAIEHVRHSAGDPS